MFFFRAIFGFELFFSLAARLVIFVTLERSKRLLLLLLSKNHHAIESFLLREFLFCPFSFLERRFRSNRRQRREREREKLSICFEYKAKKTKKKN